MHKNNKFFFMKKILVLFLFLFVNQFLTHGQYVLLKFNVNDCPRCLKMTDSIVSTDHAVPMFIVFADYELEDKRDIIQQLGDTSGLKVPILFNDKLYEKLLKYPVSGLYYFNNRDEMIFFRTIDKLQISDMEVVDSIYKQDFKFKYKKLTHVSRLINTQKYECNLQTGSIDIGENPGYRIKITSAIEKRIIDTMKAHKSGFYDLSELHQSVAGVKEKYYNMMVNYYDVWKDNVFVPVSSGYLEYEGKDTSNMIQKIKDDDSLLVDNFMALLKFEKDTLIDIYPCFHDGSSPIGRTSNLIKVISDSTFLLYYGSYETVVNGFEKGRKDFLLAEYVLRNGQLVFKKRLNLDVPESYKDFGLRTSDFSFVALDYPYLASMYGNVIYNLEVEKTYKVNPLFHRNAEQIIYFSPLNADTSLRGKIIRNNNLFFDAQKQKLYLFSQIANNGYYLSIIDASTMKEMKSIKLSSIKIPLTEDSFPFVSVDVKDDIIYLEDRDQKVRGYPLSLISSFSLK